MQFRIAALAEAQQLLYESDQDEEQALWEALEQLADRYDPTDFDVAALRADIEHDRRLLLQMLALVQPLTPERDANLQTLRARLSQPPLAGEKVLTLTQYADTAQWLHERLARRIQEIHFRGSPTCFTTMADGSAGSAARGGCNQIFTPGRGNG